MFREALAVASTIDILSPAVAEAGKVTVTAPPAVFKRYPFSATAVKFEVLTVVSQDIPLIASAQVNPPVFPD